ncbi:DMT family transporter [Notoacmeibacter ruber]|uniref:DMT family transporter n=1 Tax=Notoacmeibacter ruber TaxID=2670375 RepID=A0A3L7J8W6_9HYPH|nr:DMT family transporter [Notoacmeibacter ruber]RLQ87066.1 DMT family transporter [Notoacmeibacter ruber]
MPIWVLITITAAFSQNIRSSLQKYLKGRMGTTGATFVRFGFGLPVAAILYALLRYYGHYGPAFSQPFLFWVFVAAISQIVAQALLVHLFSYRNFAVGTAYSRTEPAQAALFGILFLGESLGFGGAVAVILTVFGVMLISLARSSFSIGGLVTGLLTRTAGIGLASGLFFGIAAVAYRAASTSLHASLPAPDYLIQASFTLLCAITIQTIVMMVWMALRERDEFLAVARAWKPAALVGLVGALTSFGWFAAMTLQQAALVKALGQVEMLFVFGSTVLIFREKIAKREILGCLFIVAGILVLLLSR